jgi:hypothetical protein
MFPCHAGTTCRGSHEYLDIDSDSAADVWRGLSRPLRAVASIGGMNCLGALAADGRANAIATFNTRDFAGVATEFGIAVLTPAEIQIMPSACRLLSKERSRRLLAKMARR